MICLCVCVYHACIEESDIDTTWMHFVIGYSQEMDCLSYNSGCPLDNRTAFVRHPPFTLSSTALVLVLVCCPGLQPHVNPPLRHSEETQGTWEGGPSVHERLNKYHEAQQMRLAMLRRIKQREVGRSSVRRGEDGKRMDGE